MSTKPVDEVSHRVGSDMTSKGQQETSNSDREGNNAAAGDLTPGDACTCHEYFVPMENKYWEIQEEGPGSQIEDVQGRISKNLSFRREVLQAPDYVLD